MSTVGPAHRSFLPITHTDLHRLAAIARQDQAAFFAAHPDWAALYADRLLALALCQGAALHYVSGEAGINDFDVYAFYAEHPARRWYAKRHAFYDFGDPKFGQSADKPSYVGRRVDILGRGIPAQPDDDPVAAVRAYLQTGRTETARLLAQKAVVLLELEAQLGQVLWPLEGSGGKPAA